MARAGPISYFSGIWRGWKRKATWGRRVWGVGPTGQPGGVGGQGSNMYMCIGKGGAGGSSVTSGMTHGSGSTPPGRGPPPAGVVFSV